MDTTLKTASLIYEKTEFEITFWICISQATEKKLMTLNKNTSDPDQEQTLRTPLTEDAMLGTEINSIQLLLPPH